MRFLFCDLSAVNQYAQNVSFQPMKEKVGATGSVSGNEIITDSFESKTVLGREDNKQLFITTQTGTAVNGQAATNSTTRTRDANLVKKMKDDFCARFDQGKQDKWNTACTKAGSEDALVELIRGFSTAIAKDKPSYSAWHNNNPTVTGTQDTNKDTKLSPQELSFNTKKGQAPQYCIPLDNNGNIQVEVILPPPTQKEDTPPIVEKSQQTQSAPPPVSRLLAGTGRFAISYQAMINSGGTEVSFNLYHSDTDGLSGNSATVTFTTATNGELRATVTKEGKEYTYDKPEDITAILSNMRKTGMMEKTGASTYSDNGDSRKSYFDGYREGGFNNRVGAKLPVMEALRKACHIMEP